MKVVAEKGNEIRMESNLSTSPHCWIDLKNAGVFVKKIISDVQVKFYWMTPTKSALLICLMK